MAKGTNYDDYHHAVFSIPITSSHLGPTIHLSTLF